METPTRIVVIVAGTNEPSNCNVLADHFINGMQSAIPTLSATKVRLKDLSIDHFTLDRYKFHCHNPQDDFCRIEDLLAECHGVVIASPIWNFSVPSHLKNLIDRLGSFALDQETHSKGLLKRRPFFFIYTGGAPKIAWRALMYITTLHLSEAIKYYDGAVIGRHFEPKCLIARGKFGLVVDKRPRSLDAMEKKGQYFARIVHHYKETGKLPFLITVIQRFFEFFYRVGNRIMYPISELQ